MSDTSNAPTIECPFCMEQVHEDAVVCKHCGASRKFGGGFLTLGLVFASLSAIAVIILAAGWPDSALFLVFLLITVPTTAWAFVQAKLHKEGRWYR